MDEPKQPIRLTHQRAEALLVVFESGVLAEEDALRTAMQFATILSADELRDLRERDVRLAAAKDAAAIIRHRYTGTDIPFEPAATLF